MRGRVRDPSPRCMRPGLVDSPCGQFRKIQQLFNKQIMQGFQTNLCLSSKFRPKMPFCYRANKYENKRRKGVVRRSEENAGVKRT